MKNVVFFAPARPMAALAAVLALCMGLSGCGTQGESASSTSATAHTPTATAESAETAEAAVATPSPEAGFLDVSAYEGTVLAETPDAGEDYIADTLFIGDSNTVRYYLYGATDLGNNIGVTSMGVGSINSLGCVDFVGYASLVTIPNAVKIIQPQRVVFSFGSNNLGGSGGASGMVSSYEKAIQNCYKKYPYFTVIVNSIPALDKNRANTKLKQSQVDEYNEALAEMCAENGWYFLDSAAALKDTSTGWAKSGYTLSDGLHLSEKGVTALFDYIRTHAIEQPDMRPKPLAAIPKHRETPEGLLGDPLAASNKTTGQVNVPVEFKVEGGGYLEGSTKQSVAKGGSTSQVWAKANEGWRFDHWTFSIADTPNSDQEAIVISIPETIDANGVIATAWFVEDVVADDGTALVPDIYGNTDASQYCGYCGNAGHSYDNCAKRQADGA